MGSLDKPTQGEAIVLDPNISDLTHKKAAYLKYKYWIYFQVFNLLQFILYMKMLNLHYCYNNSIKEREKAVMEALDWVGLTSHANKKPDKLSGGESQRVAIARAMVKDQKFWLMSLRQS